MRKYRCKLVIKMFALALLLLQSIPSFRRGATPVLSALLLLMKLQNRLGLLVLSSSSMSET